MKAYLEYKMKQCAISRKQIQNLIGISEKALRNKLSGKNEFLWSEVRGIRNTYFPDEEYETLFADVNEVDEKPKTNAS